MSTELKASSLLRIIERPGVCPVLSESRVLLTHALREKKCTVLDMGTGTGYIALSLAKLGFLVVGVDIDPAAIENTKENAIINSLQVKVFKSDLFSEVRGKYDIIIFNTPTFVGNKNIYKVTLLFARLFPAHYRKYLSLLHEIPVVRGVVFRRRKGFIVRFLSECRRHLNPQGKVFMCASKEDLDKIIIPYCKYYSLALTQAPAQDVIIKRFIVKVNF